MHAKHTYSFSLLGAALLLVGAGCFGSAQPPAPAPTPTPTVNQPVISPEVTVALLVNDGDSVPSGAQFGDTIGCNDRIAYVGLVRPIATRGDDLSDALVALLSLKQALHNGYYNGLWQSNASLDRAQTIGGATHVYLTGQFISAGTCDDPRIKEQVEETIERNVSGPYTVYLNNSEAEWRCLNDQSGECK